MPEAAASGSYSGKGLLSNGQMMNGRYVGVMYIGCRQGNDNFRLNTLSALVACCFFSKKPSVNHNR